MTFRLDPLPYADSALEPYISQRTLTFHYGKHHQGYVNKLNELTKGKSFEKKTLEQIMQETAGKADMATIFNNAAQVWNHDFYWKSMRPAGAKVPSEELLKYLEDSFGSLDDFKAEFKEVAVSQFGSGWAWLVKDEDQLRIIKTSNADNPLVHNLIPLMTCDVWEHAYYLEYQNRRIDYVNTFLNHLINWDFIDHNLAQAR